MKNSSFELGLDELSAFASKIASEFKEGVIILKGDLASGKTTFTKEFAKALGLKESVSSPTFSLMQDYGGVFHYDLYRVGLSQIIQNGLFENFFEDGVHIVEWGDDELVKRLEKFGIPLCVIKISKSPKGRKYEVSFA